MKIQIFKECGFEEALYGLGLSYGLTSNISYDRFINNNEPFNKVYNISLSLYNKNKGHNKFLEFINIWMLIQAPRYLLSEIDTYRLSTKQSESTMHTLSKYELTNDNFEYPLSDVILNHINEYIRKYNMGIITIDELKNELPEGFLQARVWKIDYKTLRNIIVQRRNHRLPQWKQFCSYMLENIEHKEYFEDLIGE